MNVAIVDFIKPQPWGCPSVHLRFFSRLYLCNGLSWRTGNRLKCKVLACRYAFWQFRPHSVTGSWHNMAETSCNSGFSKHELFEAVSFATDCRIDVEVGENARSWCEDMPFGSFGYIWLPEIGRIWPKLPKIAFFF